MKMRLDDLRRTDPTEAKPSLGMQGSPRSSPLHYR